MECISGDYILFIIYLKIINAFLPLSLTLMFCTFLHLLTYFTLISLEIVFSPLSFILFPTNLIVLLPIIYLNVVY